MHVGTAAMTSEASAPPPPEVKWTPQERVRATWEELGHKIRPLFGKVFVRTDPVVRRIGLIWLPPKYSNFHGGMGHLRLVTAVVLSTGPQAKMVKTGERIAFQRLQFGSISKLEDGTFVGYLEQEQVAGYPDDDFYGSLEGMTATI